MKATNDTITESDTSDHSTQVQVLDHVALLSFVDGDEDLLREVSALFLKSYPALLMEIRDAILRDDGVALSRAAHSLSGSGGHFLTESARLLLTEMERTGRAGELNRAPEQLVDLQAEFERLAPELVLLAEGRHGR